MSFYNVMHKIMGGPVRVLFRVSVSGAGNLPDKEHGYLLCSNHTSLLDVFVIAVSVDRQIKFMAKKELFSVPLLRRIIRGLGAFPVDRKGSDIDAIKKTVSTVKGGETVGIFPQGTRHQGEDPRKTEVKHGIGLISYRAGCDIIPVFIKTKKRQVKIFRKTEVIIGKVIKNGELGFADGGMKEYRHAAEYVFNTICDLEGDI